MKLGDILIIAGVVFAPLLFGIFFALLARANPDNPGALIFLSFASFAIAGALGLITTGILLRKRK